VPAAQDNCIRIFDSGVLRTSSSFQASSLLRPDQIPDCGNSDACKPQCRRRDRRIWVNPKGREQEGLRAKLGAWLRLVKQRSWGLELM